MQILLSAATPFEIAPTISWLEQHFEAAHPGDFIRNEACIQVRITGIGMMATAWNLANIFAQSRPDLVINAGIGGAFDKDLQLGDVLYISQEQMADLGVETADGKLLDLFDLDLLEADGFPFQNKKMLNPDAINSHFLPHANGITVNCGHGERHSISRCLEKYPDAQIESMEGAAVFYACLQAGLRFMELRAVSNYVTPRNREEWNIPLAISRLNHNLRIIFSELFDA